MRDWNDIPPVTPRSSMYKEESLDFSNVDPGLESLPQTDDQGYYY